MISYIEILSLKMKDVNSMPVNQPYGSVLLKADDILEFLSSDNNQHRLSEIAEATNLNPPTASKILNTLLLIGYVQKDPDTKMFSLGPRLMKYANKSLHQLSIKRIAQSYLEELQEVTGETVHLGIQEFDHIKYVAKIASKKPVSLYSEIGKSIPMYCSAMGKAVLADLSDEDISYYLEKNELQPKTERTIVTEERLFEEINQARKDGFAYDDGEHDLDVFCIGSSITVNHTNYGAISVSLPKYRLFDDVLKHLQESILATRNKICIELS